MSRLFHGINVGAAFFGGYIIGMFTVLVIVSLFGNNDDRQGE